MIDVELPDAGGPVLVKSAEELSEHLTFSDVYWLEQSARRTWSASGDENAHPDEALQRAYVSDSSDRFQVRMDLAFTTPSVSVSVKAVAVYQKDRDLDIEQGVIPDFIARYAAVTLWPFLTQAVRSLTTEVGGKPVMLRVAGPSDIRVEADLT